MPPKTVRPVVPDSPPGSPAAIPADVAPPIIPPLVLPPVIPAVQPVVAPPAAPIRETYVPSSSLVELPYFYLLDRSNWTDFKRSLNNCGLTWSLPDWMSTIVYKGEDYKKLEAKSDISQIFKLPTINVGEVKVEVGSGKSRELINLLGFPKSIGEYIQPSTRYCNLTKLDFEPESKLPARQKLWTWILKSLYGPKNSPGAYYYLTNQVAVYDISHLFKRLVDTIETVTICSLDDEVYNVTHLEFDPSSQNIFGYLEELRRAIAKLNDLNERLPAEGRVILSESYVRSRLIRAARQIPSYKSVVDQLVILPVAEWSIMSLSQLVLKLECAQANDLSLVPRRQRAPTNTSDDVTVQAHHTQMKQKSKICHNVTNYGTCKRQGCTFLHPTPEQKVVTPPPAPSAPPAPRRVCGVCDKSHARGKCEYKCSWCNRLGHKEEKCFDKLANKPKVMLSEFIDGELF
jgi:hypothetical protein